MRHVLMKAMLMSSRPVLSQREGIVVSVLAQHTTQPSFDGYLYQLHVALRTLSTLEFGQLLGIEKLDDVHVEDSEGNIVMTQVKFHDGSPEITDFSVDVWKTLGIWSKAILAGEIDVSRTSFTLMTTATLKADSVISEWAGGANLKDVEAKLLKIAAKSKSKELAQYIKAFVDLKGDRIEFLGRVSLLTSQPSFTDIEKAVRRTLLQGGFRPETLDKAIQHLCGWLYKQVIDKRYTGWVLRYEDFHNALSTVRDEMNPMVLPALYGSYSPPYEELANQQGATYVAQLIAVKASDRLRHNAMVAFLRVFKERTDWVTSGHVMPNELADYDSEIHRRWDTVFTNLLDEIGQGAADEKKAELGLKMYREFYAQLDVPIRSGWKGQYLTQGSLHGLADNSAIGWHPEWEQRFKKGGGGA